ncbi:hypothetical protein [Sinorhizobium medicae]|uniref:hypothetical protein n=1 Tax=Sinorhizobium medicae TaxID=110321 RepID=UPI001297F5FC|nr:hypothetical protein [Sinorhizobium medicae]MQX78109.1 hypothetical protein [Sinorhizobium medicae]
MTTGEEIFWQNARRVLRDMGMARLDPAHGAAVDAVRWCLLVRGRPTHHRQRFLENEALAILVYLEKLASNGEAQGWRTLEERIRFHTQVLHENGMQPCARRWLAAIWHALPEMAVIGQTILDRLAHKNEPGAVIGLSASDTATGSGGEDGKGSSGKAGSATANKPRRPSRLALPIVTVTLTSAEEKALDLGNDAEDLTTKNDVTPDGPEGSDGPAAPKPPGGLK